MDEHISAENFRGNQRGASKRIAALEAEVAKLTEERDAALEALHAAQEAKS